MSASTLAGGHAARLAAQFGDDILSIGEFRGETTVVLAAGRIADAALFCRDELRYDLLLDLCSVDLCGADPRFEVVYELLSTVSGSLLRLKCPIGEENPEVASVSGVWPTADWHEREVWDMMGIRFAGHPDLRRILMWEGYPHHPLRKEFPLEGLPTDVPEVAFTEVAPLEGGPFVTIPSSGTTGEREPRARHAGDLSGKESEP
jgi:NADH-quinone oxidoreductase subunit C